ncbi:hypothetical protein SAY86_023602 [Trapa natans]|uniref:Uncharacterized protein n=1 Tax=Trapa natans TaxID=22666 RepID=A0AAN7LV76_TRANT|nr:hypothetical protein SAY86_023602 [Trapa natans]
MYNSPQAKYYKLYLFGCGGGDQATLHDLVHLSFFFSEKSSFLGSLARPGPIGTWKMPCSYLSFTAEILGFLFEKECSASILSPPLLSLRICLSTKSLFPSIGFGVFFYIFSSSSSQASTHLNWVTVYCSDVIFLVKGVC